MKTLFFIIVFLAPALLTAQDFNYVHYDTKDGLAGSTVYTTCQDKDGFIWFGTENGLSRFDGTSFKNFTVKDGLPDNEVLKVFADSRGRVWVGTFSKEICFIYKGKIHNRQNDSLVKHIDMEASAFGIAQDKDNFVGISAYSSVTIITPSDSVIKYNLKDIFLHKYVYGNSLSSFWGKLMIGNDNYEAFEFKSSNRTWIKNQSVIMFHYEAIKTKLDSFSTIVKTDLLNNRFTYLSFPGKYISAFGTETNMMYMSTTDGAWDIDTTATKALHHFLPGKKVSTTMEDKEANLWFSTLGEGVYKLTSTGAKTFSFYAGKNSSSKEVFSIAAYRNGVLAGMEANQAKVVDKNLKVQEISYMHNEILSGVNVATNRLYSMVTVSDSVTVLGFDKFLVKLENGKSLFNYIFPIKSVAKINDDFILVATSAYTYKIRLKDMRVTDTLWRERCTKVFYYNSNYYMGTLRGLYEVKEDKSFTWLGNFNNALARRITDIKNSADGTLWVSTSDAGVVGYKNGRIIKAITDSNGLISNICKTLFIHDNYLWVGTDKGINKVSLNDANYDIIRYGTSDGLPSNVINALYVKDSMVWVGSPAGLTYFNEKSVSRSSICNLKMLAIKVSGREIQMDSIFNLSYKDNNINFEYAGISFRSGGEIIYYYKLTPLDNDWKTTTEHNLDYRSLPGGDYKLSLYAVNKYGIKSATQFFNFSIATPFWKAGWFYTLLSVMIIAIVVAAFNRRNRITRQRLEEKNNFQKQFAMLEQQALQSQMNPHFIFNCLNSIQQYILTNDKQKANEYLTGFASLIRQTLDISAQKTITVAEEASYLTRYIEMERMRFGDSFNYTITIDDGIKTDYIQMPALLLQPYVENCIRHGLRYKTDGTGKIEISFSLEQGALCCIIKDNGIGRKKAAEFKSRQHIEYQSKGMNLTSKRIQLLNTMEENNISVMIQDLKNDDETPAGTLVQINITI